jgi:hypothetical protein
MKGYAVDVDLTVSRRIYVEAENEEQAKARVSKWVVDDPYFYLNTADAFVGHKVIDVNEDDEY